MSDLVEFLTARLDEDAAAARDAYYEGQRWITEEEGVYRYPDDDLDLVHYANRKTDARHIARWDPARVLREVEAKRAVLAEHQSEPMRNVAWNGCKVCRDPSGWPQPWPCHTLRHIIAVYSDHPDYQQEWKP
jgi:Family of unknown function (DUF6221)